MPLKNKLRKSLSIYFVKTSKGVGSRMLGKLKWFGDEYDVVTGGYGRGAIPDGMYDIEVYNVTVGTKSNMKSGFVNPITGKGWFIPLKSRFSTTRKGFGIHPDGNKPGTKGCLGLQGNDIKKFWDKWNRVPIKKRPTRLHVTTKLKKAKTNALQADGNPAALPVHR